MARIHDFAKGRKDASEKAIKDAESKTRPGEEDYTGHKKDESKARTGDEDYEAHKGSESKTHKGKDFEDDLGKLTGELHSEGPSGERKTYRNPGGDPYSYAVHEDGSIEITDGPTGKGTVWKDGPIWEAIRASLDKLEGGGEKITEVAEAIEVETPADAPPTEEVSLSEQIEGLQPEGHPRPGTFAEKEGDKFDKAGNLIPGALRDVRDDRREEEIIAMGPDRSQELYKLAERLLGTPR